MDNQELKPSAAQPILRGSDGDDSKKQLEYVTAIPTPNPEEDAHYLVACEAYMEPEPENLEEW